MGALGMSIALDDTVTSCRASVQVFTVSQLLGCASWLALSQQWCSVSISATVQSADQSVDQWISQHRSAQSATW